MKPVNLCYLVRLVYVKSSFKFGIRETRLDRLCLVLRSPLCSSLKCWGGLRLLSVYVSAPIILEHPIKRIRQQWQVKFQDLA